MLQFPGIQNGDKGSVVRALLNDILIALTTGYEGVNALWEELKKQAKSITDLSETVTNNYKSLSSEISGANDYTDQQVGKLQVILDATSGVAGFAPTPDYNPNIPVEKAANIIAVGAGTYTYFLDSTGTPITIEAVNSITVFYKGKGVSYWEYKTLVIEPPMHSLVENTGTGTVSVSAQNEVDIHFSASESKTITCDLSSLTAGQGMSLFVDGTHTVTFSGKTVKFIEGYNDIATGAGTTVYAVYCIGGTAVVNRAYYE